MNEQGGFQSVTHQASPVLAVLVAEVHSAALPTIYYLVQASFVVLGAGPLLQVRAVGANITILQGKASDISHN